jgi:hypothetical protein
MGRYAQIPIPLPRVFSRHANAPLAGERNTFLKHLAARGTPRSTLLRYARQLRVIAVLLDSPLPGPISHEEIARCAQRWAQGQRQPGHAQGLKWPREHFLQVASAWVHVYGVAASGTTTTRWVSLED